MVKYYWRLVLTASLMTLAAIILATFMLYPLRNSKKEAVGDRFIRHNDIIEREVGEIKEIVNNDNDISSRSREIARELNGNYTKSQTNKVVGTKKTVEYKVTVEEIQYFDTAVNYFVVKEAFWRNEGGDWQKISPGFLENYFLLYKSN